VYDVNKNYAQEIHLIGKKPNMGVELLLTWNYCTLWAAYDTVTVQYVTTVNVKFITSGSTVYKPVRSLSFVMH